MREKTWHLINNYPVPKSTALFFMDFYQKKALLKSLDQGTVDVFSGSIDGKEIVTSLFIGNNQ